MRNIQHRMTRVAWTVLGLALALTAATASAAGGKLLATAGVSQVEGAGDGGLTPWATKANQMGLLGFGGDKNDSYEGQLEASAAYLLNRKTAVGVEYRSKPNNLGFAREDDWADVFVAYFPSRNLSLTAAYVDLGEIATVDNQRGPYVSIQAGF